LKPTAAGANMSEQHLSNDPHLWRAGIALARIAMPAAIVLFTGCATNHPLMPSPTVYVGQQAKPLFTDIPADRQKAPLDLLYVTDRAPATEADKTLPYSAERSHSMAFGAVTIEFGKEVPWDTLVEQSTQRKRSVPLDLKLGPATELGRFPPISYGVAVTPAGLVRTPAAVDAHEKAAAMLQAEVKRRLGDAPRKEVVLFVHGYANTFQDASFTMGELCHFLGREFVCAIFTWPAGGSAGLFFGYNVDRESGEFAVFHLKQAIRIIADTPGVEKVHLLAHSRGTDVLTTALRELEIEAYINGLLLDSRFKVRNIVLMSPDLDLDVAVAKLFSIESDPDLPYGKAPNPRFVFPHPTLRLTVYMSEGDKALGLAEYLMGSLRRLGRVNRALLTEEQLAKSREVAGFAAFIQVTDTLDFIGHSYFVSDPAVSSDLVSLIRYGLEPGDPGRPLEEVSKPFWKISPARATGE
jgi:esterase/lipase superfamily enzyme